MGDDGCRQPGVGTVLNFFGRKPSCRLELNVSIFKIVSMDLANMEIMAGREENEATLQSLNF